MKSTAGCLLVLLLWSVPASAQYGVDVWTTEQGLPQNVVRAVRQTRDGYLWVVTMDGVARFDGVRFTVFDKSATPGIASNRFLAIHESVSGDLWFGSEGGVTRYRGGVFTTFTTTHGLPDLLVTGVTGDEAGRVWVLAGDRIAQWDEGAARFRPADIEGIRFSRSRWRSDVFFGSDAERVYQFTAGKLTTTPLPRPFPYRGNGQIAQDETGVVWMGLESDAIATIRDGKLLRVHAGAEIAQVLQTAEGDRVRSPDPGPVIVHHDARGRAWTIRLDSRLSRFLRIPVGDRIERVRFDALADDRDGHVWVATYNQGLYRIRDQAVRVMSAQHGLVGRNVYPVFQARDGAIWAGAWDGGLSRWQDGRVTNFTRAQGVASRHPTALAEDAAGRLWIAGHEAPNGGLQVLEDGRFHALPHVVIADKTVVNAIYHEPSGVVWLGTSRGLVRDDHGRTTRYTTAERLAGDDVKTIVGDRRGGIWIGTSGGLSHVRDGRLTSWTDRAGLPSGIIRSLYHDAADVLWIGSYDGGLARFKDGRFTKYTVRDGLFNNGVFQILESDEGHFFMSCNRGVYRVDKRELTDVAEGRARRIHSLALGRSDGLLNAEANGGAWPAGVKARDGTLWFPTQDGLAIIDPRTIGLDRDPIPAVIESFLVDGQPAPLGARIEIGPRQRTLEIQYTALSFISPDQIRFRYTLEGLDREWADAGTRRVAHYAYLPPGQYTFRAAASNSRGIWSPAPASVSIVVRPPFWQRWWFLSLSAAIVGCLAMFAYRRRVTTLERARAAQETFSRELIASQEQERARIAAELHDSLGQSLIVICNWAALGTAVTDNGAPGREELGEIARAAERAVNEMRHIAHTLGTHDLEQLGLADALGELVERLRRSSSSTVAIRAELERLDGSLPAAVQTSLYRVAQEALSNIVKHAGATAIDVALRRVSLPGKSGRGTVTLTITDNGRGFDPAAVRAGFGLKGMAERVRLFDGEYALRSVPGEGTTIEVSVHAS